MFEAAKKWFFRNVDNLLSVGLNGIQTAASVPVMSSGVGVIVGGGMAIQGSSNVVAQIVKIFITTKVAFELGDAEADRLDEVLPDSALGLLSFKLEEEFNLIENWTPEDVGAVGDILDMATSFLFIDAAEALSIINNGIDFINLKNAGRANIIPRAMDILEDYSTLDSLKSNIEQINGVEQ